VDQSGEYKINAPRAEVWAGLGDLDRVKRCLSGCQSLEQTGEGEFLVSIESSKHERSPGLSEPLVAEVRLAEVIPPSSCLLNVGSGSAVIQLTDAGEGTGLSYQAGGELADTPAVALADEFFVKFAAEFETVNSDYEPSQQWIIWAIMFAVLLLAVILTI